MKKRGALRFRRIDKQILLVTLAAFFVLGSIALAVLKPWEKEPSALPPYVLQQITSFNPYFYEGEVPHEYKLDKGSIKLSGNILFLRLVNPQGRTILITEQALPQSLSTNTFDDAKKVEGVDGIAVITYGEKRTVGTFLTNEKNKKRALILVHTSDPIETEHMEDMLRSLREVKN